MTSIMTFLYSKDKDIFVDRNDGEEYYKTQLDEGFQYEQDESAITIEEYYNKLINYLQRFRKLAQHNSLRVKN